MPEQSFPRREFLKAIGAAAVAGPSLLARSAAADASPPAKRPNVLMIVADDQRSDMIHALGNDYIQTPNLDRLVQSGFAFRRARVMGAQQGAVCVPARAMLMTGRTLFRIGENLPPGVPTMPQVIGQAGYSTFGCGKWHNGQPSFERAFKTGSNIFFGGMHDQYNTPVHELVAGGELTLAARAPGKFSSELFADAAVNFLKKQDGSEPFFCYLAFTSPHDPRTPPPPYDTMYDPKTMPLPANFLPEHPFDNGELHIRDEQLAPFPRTPEDTRKQLCDYYGMITSQDAQVGRMLAALQESGQADNTIIVYTGDHGLAIGSHGLFGKQNVYEHSSGIPMIISGPGIPKGQTSDALVYGFDVFPTLCDLLAIQPPATIEGKSLSGIMAGREQSVRDAAFHAYIKHATGGHPAATQLAVNDGRWKYMKCACSGVRTTRLFDLQNDPAEMMDLSADTKAVTRMDALLTRLSHELGGPA